MSNTQQPTITKPRSLKCRLYCLVFDVHNYYPTCRESGKGDDPCVTNVKNVCTICSSFTNEQINKIRNRRRYVRKQKAVADT